MRILSVSACAGAFAVCIGCSGSVVSAHRDIDDGRDARTDTGAGMPHGGSGFGGNAGSGGAPVTRDGGGGVAGGGGQVGFDGGSVEAGDPLDAAKSTDASDGATPACDSVFSPTDPLPAFVSAAIGNDMPIVRPTSGGVDFIERQDASGSGYGTRVEQTSRSGDVYVLLGGSRFASVARYRGLQIIDASDPAAPKVLGELPDIGLRASILGVVSGHAIVSAYDPTTVVPRILSVDVTDAAHPALSSKVALAAGPATIMETQWVQSGTAAAVYTALMGAPGATGGPQVPGRLIGVDASGGSLVSRGETSLPGTALNGVATPGVMLFADMDPASDARLLAFDTSSPTGVVVTGGIATLTGWRNVEAMEVRGGIARVFGATLTNGAEQQAFLTYDIHDPRTLTPIDACPTTEDARLVSPRFLPERVVGIASNASATLGFAVDASGHCTELPKTTSAGAPMSFALVANGTRMLGFETSGSSTEGAQLVLYDVAETASAVSALARLDLGVGHEFAVETFTMLEGVVSATASDGTPESGLLLLPFAYLDPSTNQISVGIQAATFSDHTLSLRGTLTGLRGPMNVSLESTDARDITLLGEFDVLTLDAHDPDHLSVTAAVDRAPNYSAVFRVGQNLARVHSPRGGPATEPVSSVELIADGDTPQLAPVLGRFSVPSTAAIYAYGDRLVTLTADPVIGTELDVYDVSDPTAPRREGVASIPELSWHSAGSSELRCVSTSVVSLCSRTLWPDVVTVPNALVFVTPLFDGGIALSPPKFDVVNVSDPAAPSLSGVIDVPCNETPKGIFREGSDVYFVSARLVSVVGQRFPNAAYFMRRIDVSDPATPVLGDPVNVPGQPFAASSGGAEFFSVEHAYVGTDGSVSGTLHRFRIDSGVATILATLDVSGSELTGVALHADGRLAFIDWGSTPASMSPNGKLTLAESDTLAILGASSEPVQWRGARCEESSNIALEQIYRLAAIDTRAGSGLAVRAGFAGPTLGVTSSLQLRSLACGDQSIVWAGGLYGMGTVQLTP